MEVKAFAISDFVPQASGGCDGADRSSWDDMVDGWYEQMGDEGHTRDGQFYNGAMTLQRFCDLDTFNASCQDHLFVDDADAAMIGTHGKDNGDHWTGTMRARWQGQCGLEAGGSAIDMHVGDMDLEFLHLSSCFSADDDNLSPPGGTRGVRAAMTDPVDGGFAHLLTGFHGVMYIQSVLIDDYENFVHDAHSIGMALSWLTNHTHLDYASCNDDDESDDSDPGCQDLCPVAVSQGQTAQRAWDGIISERYNNVYNDPTGNGYWYYWGIENCDAIGETSFNP
jgi:hypothetical protein